MLLGRPAGLGAGDALSVGDGLPALVGLPVGVGLLVGLWLGVGDGVPVGLGVGVGVGRGEGDVVVRGLWLGLPAGVGLRLPATRPGPPAGRDPSTVTMLPSGSRPVGETEITRPAGTVADRRHLVRTVKPSRRSRLPATLTGRFLKAAPCTSAVGCPAWIAF